MTTSLTTGLARLVQGGRCGIATSFVLVALGLSTAANAKCEPDVVAQRYPKLAGRTIKVGQTPTSPPYSFADPNAPSEMLGFDADMTRAVFGCLGVKTEFVTGPWSGLLPALIAGQTEVMWSNLFYTPARGEQVDFVTYRINATSGLVRKGNPHKIKSDADVCGLRASGELGSVEEAAFRSLSTECVKAGKKPIEIFTSADKSAAVRMLANDRIDVMLLDTGAAGHAAKTVGDVDIAYTVKTEFMVAVGVNRKEPELRQAIFDAMRIIQADGTQAAIMQRYGIDPALMIPTQIIAK